MCVQNLKFVALPIPKIIKGTPKMEQSVNTPTLPFLQNFNGFLFGWTLGMYRSNLKFVALPVPKIIAIGVFGRSYKSQILGKRRLYGVGDGTVRKSVGEIP